jgi:hypothetical protein
MIRVIRDKRPFRVVGWCSTCFVEGDPVLISGEEPTEAERARAGSNANLDAAGHCPQHRAIARGAA